MSKLKVIGMMKLELSPFPVLKTERLILRKIELSDAPALFNMRSHPEVLRYLDKEPFKNTAEAEDFIREKVLNPWLANEGILWVLCLKDNPDELIGTTGFWRMIPEHFRTEIGYILHPDHWRKGLMKEALLPTIDYMFRNSSLHSIEANIDPANEPSGKLLESCGFVKEGHFKENYYFNGVFKDSIIYSCIKTYPPMGIAQ